MQLPNAKLLFGVWAQPTLEKNQMYNDLKYLIDLFNGRDLFDRKTDVKGMKRENSTVTVCEYLTMITKKK